MEIIEKWSTLEEVADHLGVSKDTVRKWIRKEVIPHYRVGKKYRFKLSEIDKWIESGESAEID